MIKEEEVKNIAKLARIGVNKQEAEKFQKELTAILAFIDKLKEVDVEGVEPTAQVAGLHSVVRPDESIKREQIRRQKLLANAPETKDNFIKVKAVFD